MDYYEILQVHPKADQEAIQAAYERLRARYDPARLDGVADELVALARTRHADIERAYAVLSDAAQRRAYDEQAALRAAAVERLANNSPDRGPSSVVQPAPSLTRGPSSSRDDQIDYRPLPPAGRQERPKDFAVQPTLVPAGASPRRSGRASIHETEQPAWMAPLLVGFGLMAVIAAVTFFAAALTIPTTETRTSAGPAAVATAQAALSPTEPVTTDAVVNQFEALIPAAQQQAQSTAQSPDAWVNLGNLLYDSVQVVRENMPDSPLYQQRLPRWLAASDAYSKALDLQPNNVGVRSDRGVSLCYYGTDLRDQKYVIQGLQEVQQAAQQSRSDPRVLFNLGVCQSSTDPPQIDQALESWRQVASMSTTEPSLATQAQRLIDEHSKK